MKTMWPPGYHHNGFVATHALGQVMHGYTLLVPVNQRVLNKLSKGHNISGHNESALSTREPYTRDYVTLLKEFHGGTLSMHLYIGQKV